MVNPDTLLHEALAGQGGVTWLDANRGSRADAVEQLIAVVDRLHAELGQQLAIELASDLEAADRQDHVSHAVDFDGHWSSLSPSGSQTQRKSECETPLRVAAARNERSHGEVSHRCVSAPRQDPLVNWLKPLNNLGELDP